jgi:signal transduction histidine kinase
MEYKSIKGLRYFLFIFLGFLIIADIAAYFVFMNIINNSGNDYKNDRYSNVNSFIEVTKERFNKYQSPIDFINQEQDFIRRDFNQRNVYAYYVTDSTLFPILQSKTFNFEQKYIRNFFIPILKDNLSMRYFIDDYEVYSFKIENLNKNALFAVIVYKTNNDYIIRIIKYFMFYRLVVMIFILIFAGYLIISIEKPMKDISGIAKSLNMKFDSNDQNKVVKVFRDSIEEIVRLQREQEKEFNLLTDKYNKMEKDFLSKEGMIKLSEITNGIAHQLNNQLGAILGLLQASQKNNDPKIIETAYSQLKILSDFTNKFLEFSKDIKPYLSKVNLTDIITNISQRYGVAVKYEDSPEQMFVQSDELLLEQVFINVFDNISKYSKEKRAIMSIKRFPNRVSVELADFGPGYPESVLNNLYRPFLDTSHGYGLGIPTVIKLASILNHRVSFKNINDNGVFVIEFAEEN